MDPSFIPPTNPSTGTWTGWEEEDWNTYTNWEDWSTTSPWRPKSPRGNRPKSPRSQTPQAPRQDRPGKGQGKGKKGKKGKGQAPGKGKGKGGKQTAIPPEPAWQPQAAADPPPPAPAPTPSEMQFQQLLHALRKADTSALSPEVQGILATADKQASRTEVKTLYSAVGRINQAQKQLHQAQTARTNLHINWNTHLLESIDRWRSYTTEFGTMDAEFVAQINAAREALQSARQTLAEQKETGNASEPPTLISDQEELPDAEADRTDSASSILQGLQTMVTSLVELQKQTEEMLPERKNKRARTVEPSADAKEGEEAEAKGSNLAEAGKLPSTAMQPFGGGR